MFQLCACHSDTPQYNSSETFRNVPLLLSHVCLCAVRFDGYIFSNEKLMSVHITYEYRISFFVCCERRNTLRVYSEIKESMQTQHFAFIAVHNAGSRQDLCAKLFAGSG